MTIKKGIANRIWQEEEYFRSAVISVPIYLALLHHQQHHLYCQWKSHIYSSQCFYILLHVLKTTALFHPHIPNVSLSFVIMSYCILSVLTILRGILYTLWPSTKHCRFRLTYNGLFYRVSTQFLGKLRHREISTEVSATEEVKLTCEI